MSRVLGVTDVLTIQSRHPRAQEAGKQVVVDSDLLSTISSAVRTAERQGADMLAVHDRHRPAGGRAKPIDDLITIQKGAPESADCFAAARYARSHDCEGLRSC